MTIDPDDYDLRELRRIADERRGARRSDGDERSADADDAPRTRSDGRRRDRRDGRRSESPSSGESVRRNGRRRSERSTDRKREDSGRRANDETTDRERGGGGESRRNGRSDRRRRNSPSADRDAADEEVSVRPREGVSPPRRGGSDHARGHDEVVLADQIARDLGFDGVGQDRRRGGRRDEPSRGREARSDSRRRRESGLGFDSPDDVGRFEFDTEIRERPRGRAGEALRQNQLEQLLVHETAAADGGLSKPYLGSLPDAYAAERLVFDWLEFLVLKGGFKRTMDALRYYHTVEWLTADVEAELQDYLVGFSGEVSETTEYDVDDHHLSLVYIARLASMT